MDKHASRIEIFNSTLAILQQGWYISPSGQEVSLPPIRQVMVAAKMYKQRFTVDICVDLAAGYENHQQTTEVRVENKDCVQAAIDLINEGFYPVLLNLADLYTPGGLVEYGSGAQEENLCRRSNLVQSLYQFSESRIRQYPELGLIARKDQYPMDEKYGGVYSGLVTFFRGPESEGSQLLEKPYDIPVISVAALNGPRIGNDGRMFKEETAITLEKMRTIFRIGLSEGHDAIVLSAFGCGAFSNPPSHIAQLFHQVMEEDEFKDWFRLIDFAILDGYRTGLRHNPDGNLKPFQKEFNTL